MLRTLLLDGFGDDLEVAGDSGLRYVGRACLLLAGLAGVQAFGRGAHAVHAARHFDATAGAAVAGLLDVLGVGISEGHVGRIDQCITGLGDQFGAVDLYPLARLDLRGCATELAGFWRAAAIAACAFLYVPAHARGVLLAAGLAILTEPCFARLGIETALGGFGG